MGNELTDEIDWLDAKLRDEMPYIDDAGFTKQVMQKLPGSRRAPRPVRAAIILGATVLACFVAFIFAGSYVVDSAAMLAAVPMRVLAVLAVCVTAVVTICGGAVAFLKSRDARL